ncbi:MAG TPA: serine/threonine-protein kinase, partial [Kofleriaceae bacterium]|nr:serine/threonine-protein kinase [Kofleriaceae bacterium]
MDVRDAAAGPADETRTSREPLCAGASSEPVEPRLAAPLQTRDPERYEILGEHGRGGLGRVFRARDKELGRDIAVKELLERGHTTEVRFLREALITARLEHPSIVPVHEAGRWPDGTPFYAMKLVSGSPLKTLIDRASSVDARLALVANVVAVADAIAYAHDRKIIHRDLKPSNVIVGEFGETVVIDWGLAKALDEQPTAIDSPYRGTQGHELTASGSVLGTPAYMAPEQYHGIADERTDIYALGGILFHVLVGRSPHGETAQPPRDLPANAFPRKLPRDLSAIVRKAMAEQPSQRYPTARAFADDLRRYAQHQPVSARRYSVATRMARTFARHRAASLAIVGALVAVVAMLVVSLVRIDGERDEAESARNDAETARSVAEKATNDLVLQHARLLLKSDPTSALAAVAAYHGPDTTARQLIEAKARGLGVAEIVPAGHRDGIQFLAGAADGTVLSIGWDHDIRLTNGTHGEILARDFATAGLTRYAPRRRLLLYT